MTPLQERVYAFLKERGAHGATDEEIQTALHLSQSSGRWRRLELRRLGQVCDALKNRPTRAGRQAIVWVVSL